ncbi:MAG: Calx-beta domain-containing protein [Vicinamibacterales bacterium]
MAATNTDDDASGITVSAISGTTTETGSTATFTVVLDAQPTADVTVGLSSSDTTEGTVSPASVTFTSANWNTPQTVTVTGVNDSLDDGDIAFSLVTAAAASADGNYSGLNPANVAATNTDDDASGITVSAISGTTTETGSTATFTVVLDAQPTADVTVGLSSSDTTEGTVSPASVTFTSANWNTPQTVTVTGVNDSLDDGDIAFSLVTAAAASADGNYSGLNPANVAATNIDDDASGITVSAVNENTTEAGGTATFTVVLDAQPTADVTVGLSSSDTTEGTVSPASVTFTSANWNTPQTVTVTGVNDSLDDGDIAFSIVTAAAASADGNYNGLNPANVAATNTDDDASGITVSAISGTTTETGSTATFTVALDAQPTADVTLGLSSSDTTEGTVSPTSLTFTSANWNTPQTVTVTGGNDSVDDGDVAFSIITAAAVSADTNYNGLNPANVAVTNVDDDTSGITVSTISGNTSETGSIATFTVVLDAQPTADVTIGLSSSDTTEGTVSPASVTFTSANWNTPQTVTVTEVNDNVDDGDVAFSIITAAAVSADTNYSGVNPANVAVTNVDDDTSGITVSTISGNTTEAGGTATFTMVLDAQPTADVTIGLSSSDTTEGAASPSTLTFTSANWNTPQTVTVTGVNDSLDDGDVGFSIITAAATSADGTYSGLNPANVSVTNADDDASGITVSAISGNTTEAGGTATFTVVLDAQPTTDVTIGLSSSDTTEGTASPSTLTFTSANWNTPQSVTVTGVNDSLDDGDIGFSIVTAAATSGDASYNGLNPANVSVTTTDDDASGITVSAISGATSEAGGTATFTVVLDAQPTADVTIGLSSSDTTEGTASPSTLTFTSANWNTPQTVTVTGVNDSLDDGDIAFSIVTAPATSVDTNYTSVNPANVTVTNTDDDASGITVSAISGATSEAGGTATFAVVLDAQPTADVTIGLSSSDTTEGTVSPSSLTFTAANWNTPQTVTVTGVNDSLDDGDIAFSIVTAAATSADSTYNGLNPTNAAVTNADDDTSGVTVSAISGSVSEAGGTATFTVVLDSQPTADVTIGLSSSDTTEGTVSPSSLTFTAANWNAPQTATVTGVNDSLDDGDIAFSIVAAPATSADTNYSGVNPANVAVSTTDDDTAGITAGAISGATTEAGGTATFTVVLNSQPTADVTVGLSSNDTSEGTVSPSSLTFTAANWTTPQTVTVTGVDDSVDDGNIVFSIVTTSATSADSNYSGINAADVSVTNTDDDSAGITVSAISGATSESGGSASFTVVLDAQPSASVTIGLSSGDTTEGTVSPSTLVFTTANWSTPQVVTVTGVNDGLDDGDVTFSVITTAATSSDTSYSGMNPADVSVTNVDDDAAGITVSAISANTTEAGGTATFTVVLDSQPTATVTIGLSTSDPSEGTVSASSLTFTTANWGTPQTVTVSGVDDGVDDGNVTFSIMTAPATSADSNFNGVDAGDVTVINTDNDSAGFAITPTSGLVTSESGTTATFTVALTAQPSANVTFNLTSSNTSEGVVSPSALTFTPGNWGTPQTVTVTGVNDAVDDGNRTFVIQTGTASSGDGTFSGLDPADVSVTNTDDDTVGITVTPVSGLTTSESGTATTFTVVLNTQPTADVVIGLSSSDTTEGAVTPGSLTFTSANWSTPQTVTVTGVNDSVQDGAQAYSVVTAAATSTDLLYSGVDPADVTLSNADDDSAGITVTPTSGLTATESGGTATFTVVLTSQPTATVTIALSSSDTTEGTVGPATLTFTTGNWNAPQTVTVTGVSDAIDDGDVAFTIVTAAAVSADPVYGGADPADVSVTTIDDDSGGITVTPTSGLTIAETGSSATFTVVLNSQPAANVTVAVSSSDTTEGTVSPAGLTFTSGNWNTPQTVTVTGVNDVIDDGNVVLTIVTSAASSADPVYDTVDPADVTVTNVDDDIAGVTIGAVSGPTSEAGGTATFTVVLTSQPSAVVTVGLSSSDTTEGTVAPGLLTFTAGNWNTPQTVTATGVDDVLADGNQVFSIVTAAATSADPSFNGLNATDVTVTNTDNDAAAIVVTPTSGLSTTEAGGSATFTVALGSQPTASVTIALSTSDATEGTVSPAALTFTTSDWNSPQTVTVTGVNDAIADGGQSFSVVTAAAVSADTGFNGVDAADVSVTNADDDAAGITVTPSSGLTTTESGGAATFTVVLTSQPAANVSVGLSSSDTSEGIVSVSILTFTTANWSTPQTVTVTGADDGLADGTVAYTVVVAAASSSDSAYNGLNPVDVSVSNSDDDSPGFIVTPTSGLVTSESGTSATFTVRLTAVPSASVTIAISSSNVNEGIVSPSSLSFTAANWSTPQTVTVIGINDSVADGSRAFVAVTGAASSTDLAYSGVDPADVSVTNADDDVAGVTVTPTSGLLTSEGAQSTNFAAVLNTPPSADVVIVFASSDETEGTVSPSLLVFTALNWNVPQLVTVTGVNDSVADGSQTFTVVGSSTTSTDPAYNGLDVADVTVTNSDNDTAGITVTPLTGLITSEQGGAATFALALNTPPTATVTIDLSSSTPGEGTVAPASVTFTPSNWSTSQTVMITGVDDAIADGTRAYLVLTAPASSSDPYYAGLDPADIAVTNLDDDAAGIEVVASDVLTTSETGASATFRVVLRTRPAATVQIPLRSSDTGEGVVAPTLITFTPDNWDIPVEVTVTGVDDALTDGTATYSVVIVAAVSGDPAYAGVDPVDVNVRNLDNGARPVTTGGTSAMPGSGSPTPGTVDPPVAMPDAAPTPSTSNRTTTVAGAGTFFTAGGSNPGQAFSGPISERAESPIAGGPLGGVSGFGGDVSPAERVAPTPIQSFGGAATPLAPSQTGGSSQTGGPRPAGEVSRAVRGLPEIRGIASRSTAEDTPLVLSSTTSTAVSLVDSERRSQHLLMTMVATHGSMSLAGTNGLQFREGGRAGAIMMFTGTIEAINVALDGLSYTPDPNYAGDATICLELDRPERRTDASSASSLCVTSVSAVWRESTTDERLAVSIPITVTAVNDGPVIAEIPDHRVIVDALAQGIPFTLEDIDTPLGAVSLRVTSSNEKLVPGTGIVAIGRGAERLLTVIPRPRVVGSTVITLTASDGVETMTRQFQFDVSCSSGTVPDTRGPNGEPYRVPPGEVASCVAAPR